SAEGSRRMGEEAHQEEGTEESAESQESRKKGKDKGKDKEEAALICKRCSACAFCCCCCCCSCSCPRCRRAHRMGLSLTNRSALRWRSSLRARRSPPAASVVFRWQSAWWTDSASRRWCCATASRAPTRCRPRPARPGRR